MQLVNTSGNFTLSISTATTGQYVLTFSSASGLAGVNFRTLPVTATLAGGTPGFITFTSGIGVLNIYTLNASSGAADRYFGFAVYKPSCSSYVAVGTKMDRYYIAPNPHLLITRKPKASGFELFETFSRSVSLEPCARKQRKST